jgi:hypothetical protein
MLRFWMRQPSATHPFVFIEADGVVAQMTALAQSLMRGAHLNPAERALRVAGIDFQIAQQMLVGPQPSRWC